MYISELLELLEEAYNTYGDTEVFVEDEYGCWVDFKARILRAEGKHQGEIGLTIEENYSLEKYNPNY